jgi:hypothetical protein
MLCSWVFQFAEPQHHDGLDDLPFLLSNSTFHYFKLCCCLLWLHVDSIQKCILRVYNEILKSWNNECIDYKVEHGNSIQKHIRRVYIIKYSNLGTMNASSIWWSMAASKLECGRPRCNLLACCISTCLLSYLMPFLSTVSPWLCFYLSTMYSFLHTVALLSGLSFAPLN